MVCLIEIIYLSLLLCKVQWDMNLSILSRRSSISLLGCFKEWYASCNVTTVDCASPKLSVLKIDKGIKLIHTPKSHNTHSNTTFLIKHGMVKLPQSLSLVGNFFVRLRTLFNKCYCLINLNFPFAWKDFFHKLHIEWHLFKSISKMVY